MPVDILAHIFREKLCTIAPARALHETVAGYYWCTSGQNGRPVWATLHGHPALLFLLDAPYSIQFTGRHTLCLQHAFFCCYGLQHTYIQAWPKGMRMLVVQFTCNGLFRLLQQPLPAVAAAPLLPVTAVWGAAGQQLAESICEAGTQAAQAALLDEFLLAQLPACPPPGYLVQAAVQYIRSREGQVNVAAVCDHLGVNYKWLERNFRNQLGITPKTYIDTTRFLHAYFSMEQPRQNLTSVALQHGYYDQAHFIKAFKKHTGKVPSLEKPVVTV
jgi:AraC-like DNA-binding protein